MSNLKTGRFFLPYHPELVQKAKEMRKNPTAAERKLWGFLRTFPLKMWRQKPIDRFIVDFYCPKLKLVIEVDGDSHFTEEGLVYDAERTRILEGYGLRVVRFTNAEVLQGFEGVCLQIMGFIPPNPPSLKSEASSIFPSLKSEASFGFSLTKGDGRGINKGDKRGIYKGGDRIYCDREEFGL